MSIKSVREAKGLTQKQFAELIGVQQGAVAQWETGKTSPTLKRAVEIAKAMDCSVDDLIRIDGG